jgi:poly-gamma-glutamate capsule biosynthesis protein CapA/YwtB (metallophosphatase superfamily)
MRIALAGDTMLGRKVGEALAHTPPESLVSDEVASAAREADLFLLNLECCISDRGEPWPDPFKPFFFRAPPQAVDVLRHIGVDAVTLANNHALDFGVDALDDTLRRLDDAGIAHVGAGPDVLSARAPLVLEVAGTRVAIVAFSDHPVDFAAREGRSGIAYADLDGGLPAWVREVIADVAGRADITIVTPHWGPNMTSRPVRDVRRAAAALTETPATLVAGHSAHVFHGVGAHPREGQMPLVVLYDLGDFLDDYAVDPDLRNDLGLLVFVDVEDGRPVRVEALPLALDYCHTRVALGDERDWIRRRFTAACRDLGTEVREEGDRLVVDLV